MKGLVLFSFGLPFRAPSMNRITSPTMMESAGFGQQISAFGSAPRFDESALFQTGEDQFEKFLRDLLPASDVCDLDRLPWPLKGQIEQRVEGIFTFHRDVHG